MEIVSLFSGAGGMDLGFIQAGHHVVWANDSDKDAVETYKRNIGDHIVHGRIEDVDITSVPEGDAVIGGFPCQGFSRANRKRSREDERNGLYLEFLEILRARTPKYFMAENVAGILSLDEGRVMEMIVADFEECGYAVEYKVFNAADFGVPQNRRRVIILGNRKDLPDSMKCGFPESSHARQPTHPGKAGWVTISEALQRIPEPEDQHNLLNHICSRYKVTNRDFTGHRRTDPNKPSPTILARGNGKGGVCAIQHPQNHRRLSVRESALVQTFPIDFEFCGLLNSMYRQVGNAVPVRFARQLGEKLAELDRAESAELAS